MPTEYELKLRLDPRHVERFDRALQGRCASSAAPVQMVGTYYDTPESWLADHALSLRVRAIDGRRIQTVKAPLGRGQGYARGEWETELPDDRLDLDAVPDRRIRGLLRRARDELTLEPVFVADFQRTCRRLERRDGTEIECAIDVGEIRCGERVEPLCEAELELCTGSSAELFVLARELQEGVDFALEPRSKAARGHALHGTHRVPPRATRPRLEIDWTIERAFKEIAGRNIAHLRAHEAILVDRKDPLGVHQMRVAIRRLRSTIALLKNELPGELTARLSAELSWCARQLAPAREWDAFLQGALAPLREAMPAERALDVLEHYARAARRRAYRKVRRALSSQRYTRMLLDWGLWLESEDWSALDPDLDAEGLALPILEKARDLLEALHTAVGERGEQIEALDARGLHALRLRVKRLRYASDALGSLYPRGRSSGFLRSLETAQDLLGLLQDTAATPALLGRLYKRVKRADRKALRRADGIVCGWQSAATGETRRRLLSAWARFEPQAPFWRE